MGSITRSHSFVSGEKPTESEWNVDIDQLFTLVNGQLDTNNVDTSSSDGVSVLNANQTITGTRTHSGTLTMADDIDLILGTNSDIKIQYDEGTDNALLIDTGVEGAALAVVLKADQGDDAGDAWKLNVADGGVITLGNDIASKGSYVTQLTLTPNSTVASSTTAIAGHATVAGNATVTGTLASGASTLASLVCTAAATFGGGTGSSGATITTAGAGTFDGILKTEDTTDATSTTDGSLQTDGGLSVAKDAILGNDVKLLTDSSVLSLGIGSDATFTHDGTTGVTIAANPVIVDSGDALTLDAHTGIFIFKDAGSEVLRFTEGNSGDVTIKLETNGKDLVFTDNGDATNMKILDAAAGINVPGEVQTTKIAYTDGDDAITIADGGGVTTSGTLTIGTVAAAGTDTDKFLVLDSSGNVDYRTGSQVLSDIGGAGSGSSTAADDISDGDAAVSIATTTGNITIDAQANDADVIIKVDDGGSAVTALTLDGSDEGNAIFVNDVQLKSDSALLEFGADLDTSLTHTDGTGLTLNSTNKLTFGDTASFVQQSADGTLRIDGEAIIDLNASTRVDVSGDLKVGEEAFINASSNANTTKGLTISQGAENNTNASIALKQDNVAHGMTDLQETTTYLNISQWFTDIGGARLRAYSENEYAIEIQGHYTTSNTTKTTAGVAAVSTYSAKKSGSSIGNNGANDNLFTIRGEEGTIRTRFLVDEDGDYHYDGADGGAFDDYSDAEMVRATAVALSDPSQIVRSKWDKLVRYQKDDLVEAGLIGAVTLEEEQEGHRGLVNGSQMQRLHTGAIWQLHCATQEIKEFYENKIAALESRLLRLEA